MKSYSNLNINKLPGSMVEIKAKVSAKELESHRDHVIEHIVADVELPGFRKGHAPKDMVVKKIGEAAILSEIAEHVIGEVYPTIVTDEKIMVIDRPEILITKLDPKEGLEFTATVPVFPEVKLPDYKEIAKKIAAKKEEVVITDEEFAKSLEEIKKAMSVEGDFTDETIKKLGSFESVDDFKKKLRSNLAEEKIVRNKDKKRAEIIEAIVEKTEMDLPQLLIDAETEKMMLQFKDDLGRMGTTLPEYLNKIGKNEKEVKADWTEPATKRVKSQIIINRIAGEEKMSPDEKEVDAQVKKLLEMYQGASKERAQEYVETMLINEQVLVFLEK